MYWSHQKGIALHHIVCAHTYSVHIRSTFLLYNYSYHYFTVAYYVEYTYSIHFSLPPVQNGAKIFDGTPLPVTCEKDVFDYLNTEYRVATERDHP